MARYAFLDIWALEDYTKPGWDQRLASFLTQHRYSVVISSLLLTELFNESWQGGGPSERGARVAAFLAKQHCVIVDPYEVWQSEFSAFPRQLRQLPIDLDLDHIPGVPREQALFRFLRHDGIFVNMGKDIRKWAAEISQRKQTWPTDVDAIIQNALADGDLRRTAKGRLTAPNKEVFLTSLDLRLLKSGSISPYLGRASLLRSVRLSSLVFWYRYIQPGGGLMFQPMPSDLADIEHISLSPYCAVATVDTKMLPTARSATKDAGCACDLLGKHELEAVLLREGLGR